MPLLTSDHLSLRLVVMRTEWGSKVIALPICILLGAPGEDGASGLLGGKASCWSPLSWYYFAHPQSVATCSLLVPLC